MLRSLDKERYLIKLGSKARQDFVKDFEKNKPSEIDIEYDIGDMEFEEGDAFGKSQFHAIYNRSVSDFSIIRNSSKISLETWFNLFL